MNSRTIDLNPERWAQVELLFDRATDMPVAEREKFLFDACEDDTELRGYLLSLLKSDMAGDSLISEMIGGVLKSVVPQAENQIRDVSGERIGPYRLIKVIGSGGMGVVYLAERADNQFEQQVAIKLVRQRLVDPQVELRLKAERQILADLDHPNIARLLDGGTTEDGTPYLVMEHIDGTPADEYCDHHRLGIDERLSLFRIICSAVHYAHQNLIVHRDIKPSNILVTEDGVPKLLDFGIARLIDTSGVATAGLTRAGVTLMTPENAAPEQITGKSITTATDTFALGIFLHRLLVGYPPLALENLPAREVALIICQQAVERPSRFVELERRNEAARDADPAKLQGIAADRRLSVDRLARRLRGDLDNILLTALRKEPERRYRSVHEMAEDIRRHQISMPVLARADTWRYRAGKFIQRHTAGVAATVLLVVLLSAFGVVTLLQNKRIAEERDFALEAATFLEEIFLQPDPARARGMDITAKEILANGAERIRRQLSDRPAIQTALMETIGRVYLNLGEYDESVAMHEESLAIRRSRLGSDHVTVAQGENELAVALLRQGAFSRAEQLLQNALETNRREFGNHSEPVARNLHSLAELKLATGMLDDGEASARSSIEIYSQIGNREPLDYAEAISTLARILQVKGDNEETEVLLREAVRIVEQSVGADHPYMAYFLQNLAVLLKSRGELHDAEAVLRRSIDVTRRILGNEHDLLGTSLVMLGSILHEKGQFPVAEAAYRDALAVQTKATGPMHPFFAYEMTSLGMLLHDMGELKESETQLRGALDIYAQTLDENHQYIGSTLTELGALLNTTGRFAEAEKLLLRAIDIRLLDYDRNSPLAASSYSVYGDTLRGLRRYEEAESLLLQSFEVLRDRDDRRARIARQALIRLYEDWGKTEEAVKYQNIAEAEGMRRGNG